jgi:hypothetical protein
MASQVKSYTRTVTNGDDRLQVLAVAAKGGWSFYILHQRVDGNKVITLERGASASHASLEAAKAAVDGAVAMAVKIGWQTKESSQRMRNLARNIHETRIYDPKLGR